VEEWMERIVIGRIVFKCETGPIFRKEEKKEVKVYYLVTIPQESLLRVKLETSIDVSNI